MSDFLAGDVIRARLQSQVGVTNIVGVAPNDKIYKFMLPQDVTFPAIMFKQMAAQRIQGTYDDPGVAFVTLQVASFADDMDGAHTLDRQVRLALERFGSTQPAGIPFVGTTLYDITVGSSADGFTPEAGDNGAFYVVTDFTVMLLE